MLRLVMIFIAICVPGVVTAAANYNRRTAFAVIYEEEDIWGSIVFHQWSNDTPIIVSVLFNNINDETNDYIEYAIHDEPVHYDRYSKSELCSHQALKSVLKGSQDEDIGDLSHRHAKMHGKRFANVEYDEKLSLFEGHPGYIVGKSFVIRQGNSPDKHRCATIYLTTLQSQRPGAIPCEQKWYPDCLVGAVDSNSTCVFSSCDGYRQYWGPVKHDTIMCRQVIANYPRATEKITTRSGIVNCAYGDYTLLRPLTEDTVL